jgi:hypothetical protein
MTQPTELLSRSVGDIDWQDQRHRIVNALRADGIETLGDLVGRSYNYLLVTPNLGPKSLKAIVQTLDRLGLQLAKEDAPSLPPPQGSFDPRLSQIAQHIRDTRRRMLIASYFDVIEYEANRLPPEHRADLFSDVRAMVDRLEADLGPTKNKSLKAVGRGGRPQGR